MIKKYILCCAFILCLTTGCQNNATPHINENSSEQETSAVTDVSSETYTQTKKVSDSAETERVAEEKTKTQTKTVQAVTTETSEIAETTVSDTETEVCTQTVSEATVDEEEIYEETTEPVYEEFTGILIDADCTDCEDPAEHDLPCMLMDSCRASGYGLDIQEEDGSWSFYPFDENGQDITWNYLLSTKRMDHLYVTVTGTLEDNIISVIDIEEK